MILNDCRPILNYCMTMDIHASKSIHEARRTFCQCILLLFMVGHTLGTETLLDCSADTTGPTFKWCTSPVYLAPPIPNVLLRLTGFYLAEDPSGVSPTVETNITLGRPADGGYRFPPGSTPLELRVRDECGNPSLTSCVFEVINFLTEIPVDNCPDFTQIVSTDNDSDTFTFNPSYGPADVELHWLYSDYYYFGNDYPALPTVKFTTSPTALTGPPFLLPPGNTTVTTTIRDTELSFSCSSTITVLAQENDGGSSSESDESNSGSLSDSSSGSASSGSSDSPSGGSSDSPSGGSSDSASGGSSDSPSGSSSNES